MQAYGKYPYGACRLVSEYAPVGGVLELEPGWRVCSEIAILNRPRMLKAHRSDQIAKTTNRTSFANSSCEWVNLAVLTRAGSA